MSAAVAGGPQDRTPAPARSRSRWPWRAMGHVPCCGREQRGEPRSAGAADIALSHFDACRLQTEWPAHCAGHCRGA